MNKPVYILGQINVPDLKMCIEQYALKLKVVLDEYQAEVLSGTTKAEKVEGNKFGNWTVLIKFPSKEHYDNYIQSEEYITLSKVRQELSDGGNIILIPGSG
jgi:uncharacterized protein (DUF1330 family)